MTQEFRSLINVKTAGMNVDAQGAEDMTPLVECLPSKHETLGLISRIIETRHDEAHPQSLQSMGGGRRIRSSVLSSTTQQGDI